MIVVKKLVAKNVSISHAIQYTGMSRNMWYYTKKVRSNTSQKIDPVISRAVWSIGASRPTYGTRRMAAALSRKLGKPINRKRIQRIYQKLGWITPAKTKKEIIKSSAKLSRPTAPNQLWQTDMTYVWCGVDRWCYCFNVLDVFTREWVAYAFDVVASKDAAIESIVNAVATVDPDCSQLVIQTDNGSQYISKKFRDSMKALGVSHQFIWRHTPQQNGHVESFHKTLKKEYLWPHDFANYQEAETVIANAFVDYNKARIHSVLGYITPHEFVARWKKMQEKMDAKMEKVTHK